MLIWLLVGGILCTGFGLILIIMGGTARPDGPEPSEFDIAMIRWKAVNYENLR